MESGWVLSLQGQGNKVGACSREIRVLGWSQCQLWGAVGEEWSS